MDLHRLVPTLCATGTRLTTIAAQSGADLVLEVASRGTARYDKTIKLDWHRRYGVRECWLLNVTTRVVTVANLEAPADEPSRSFTGDEPISSAVLPKSCIAPREFFE